LVGVGSGVLHLGDHELADNLRGYDLTWNEPPVALEAFE
jgi:hypothetical protein